MSQSPFFRSSDSQTSNIQILYETQQEITKRIKNITQNYMKHNETYKKVTKNIKNNKLRGSNFNPPNGLASRVVVLDNTQIHCLVDAIMDFCY